MADNVYYDKLKPVVEAALEAFEDGKVTMSEVWVFLLSLTKAVETIVEEAGDLSDDDLVELKKAGDKLYTEHVLPLDMPGPDFFVDPLLQNGILPGAIEGAFRLAKLKLDK